MSEVFEGQEKFYSSDQMIEGVCHPDGLHFNFNIQNSVIRKKKCIVNEIIFPKIIEQPGEEIVMGSGRVAKVSFDQKFSPQDVIVEPVNGEVEEGKEEEKLKDFLCFKKIEKNTISCSFHQARDLKDICKRNGILFPESVRLRISHPSFYGPIKTEKFKLVSRKSSKQLK